MASPAATTTQRRVLSLVMTTAGTIVKPKIGMICSIFREEGGRSKVIVAVYSSISVRSAWVPGTIASKGKMSLCTRELSPNTGCPFSEFETIEERN